MFAAPPHGDDRVITSFLCSAISPQRSLCPQYDSCVDDDDDDNDSGDDISLQWSMSPGPPTPCSITLLQGSLSPPHDCNTISSVSGGCDDGNITASQSPMSSDPPPPLSVATAAQHSSSHETMSSDLSSRKSVDLAAHGPSSPTPSPYDSSTDDSDDCICACSCVAFEWPMSSDPSSRKSDDIMGSTCPLSWWTISPDHASRKSDDIVGKGSICPASMPYDSSTADDNTGGDGSSQWCMNPGLPFDTITQQQQQAYDPTITAYNNDDYVATAQPSPTG